MPIGQELQIIIRGLRVHYKIAGSGQPILILHGWGGSSGSWIKVQEILTKEGYKVICPDFPGFGKSITPPQPWDVNDYTEWLKSFIEELKKTHNEFSKPFFLIAHSFGGRIAIRFATQYPEKLKVLILCASAGIKSKPGLKTKMVFWLSRIGNAIFTPKVLARFKDAGRNLFYIFLRHKDYVKTNGTMKETIKKVLDEDVLPHLPKIQTKTLLIWGENDKMVPVKYAYLFRKEIKNSELEILPKIGHSPHLEIPEKLAEVITRFLRP